MKKLNKAMINEILDNQEILQWMSKHRNILKYVWPYCNIMHERVKSQKEILLIKNNTLSLFT